MASQKRHFFSLALGICLTVCFDVANCKSGHSWKVAAVLYTSINSMAAWRLVSRNILNSKFLTQVSMENLFQHFLNKKSSTVNVLKGHICKLFHSKCNYDEGTVKADILTHFGSYFITPISGCYKRWHQKHFLLGRSEIHCVFCDCASRHKMAVSYYFV